MSKTKLFFWRAGYYHALSGASPLLGRESRIFWPRWKREAFAKGFMEGESGRTAVDKAWAVFKRCMSNEANQEKGHAE